MIESGAVPWWRDAVVYQIYPRSFADANGDGVGDLAGITAKLDYLDDLGVDALWLSPIFTSPMRDFGYDVADYCGIDPVFGTDADFDALIAGVHERGMRLLLDWVPNHSSDQHPWFVASRSSRDDPKRDWYVWKDRLPDGSPPNNWRAMFKGVPAWTHDDATDQSYLHLFLAEQPDLNWANPEVEAAMHDTLRYWLDRGVDGFRADVVNLIGKGDDVPDLPDPVWKFPLLATDRPFGHELLRRIRHLLDGYDHRPMMVGEVYLLRDGESASYVGTPDDPELHLSFDFRPLHAPWDPEGLVGAIESMESDFADPRWPTFVLSNHDQVRHRSRYGSEARARAAAVLALTVRGTPFLYAGEELGLEDAVVPEDRVVDPDGRDGCRAPIPWTTDGDDETGHGWPTRPWLPFPANAATHAADAQVGVAGSMHSLYRRLLRLRHDHAVLRSGGMTMAPLVDGVFRFDRAHGADRVTVVVNLGDAAVAWPDDLLDHGLLVSSDPSRTAPGGELAPAEAVVLDPAADTAA
ncbi:MAG TPA: alpha-amylase family glycosyl hydrolase [Ilumatobacteraceae bacterium]|nr:alpha-amylase family glycosyl hydrolase [Ilumatobacteraceae bacterium]